MTVWQKPLYFEDFTRYYFQDGVLKSSPTVSDVPEEIDDFASIGEAISTLQMYGCIGKSIQSAKEESHRLSLAVLRLAVEKYGEVIPTVYRGVRGNLPLSDHQVLYGSSDHEVAEFYGDVVEYKNIKGLRTYSSKKSVVDPEDDSRMDEEIIFFPEVIA